MLHSAETAHYRDNLSSGRPSLWVSLRIVGSDRHDVDAVTADPYEGEALTEGIGRTVVAVPMPREIEDMVSPFVAAFHAERLGERRVGKECGSTCYYRWVSPDEKKKNP